MVFSSNELDMIILQNGEDGTSADSKYIWVKYSQNANGVPLTDDPTGAVYIGIAYNKDSIEESNNPSDYSWSKILGDKGDDAYTIILSNENISFSVSYGDNLAIGDQSFTTDVRVFYGVTERDDFVIGEISSYNGITVSKTVNSVTLSVADNTKITAKHGYFRIPISIDGMIFYKDMSWNTVTQGVPGSVGQPALNISLGNESQNIPCNSEGVTLESFLIEIPFAAYEGFNKVACTASVGVLPSGITLGQNTGSTSDTDGLIILNVARGSNLGGNEVLQGKVVITFIIGESEVVKNFTWTKTKDGATGEAGNFTLYSLESSAPVISKTFEDTFSPESITFSAYSMEGNSGDKTEYSGMFIIEESTNGTTYDTSYLSSTDEQSVTFVPTSINVISIRCTLYKAGGITSALDIYTVPVLTDVDNMRPIIDEITTSISGLESKVDSVEKTITDKVWQSDITTQINNYDNTTVKIIRDQVAETQTSLSEIRSTVSDVQTTLTTKADGSTVQTLSEKVSNIEQDAEGFKQTVEENYVTNDKLDENSKTLRSEFNQTASEINQTVTDLSGDVTSITQDVTSIKQRVTDAEGNISSLEQSSENLKSQIESAQGDISNIQQTATSLQSQITNNKNDISQLEQDVEGFKTTVSSQLGALETNIEQTAEDIELSVSEVSDNLRDNYYNKTETDALIQLESDSITSSVKESISSEVEKIEIGGTNLIVRSTETIGSSISNNGNITDLEGYSVSDYIEVIPSTDYIFTKTESLAIEPDSYIYSWYDTSKSRLSTTTDFNSKSNLLSPSIAYYIRFSYPTDCKVKFEKGNKATDWSPAPEDVQDGIDNAQASADEANAQANAADSRITVAESTIQQLSDAISTLVVDENGESMMTQTSEGWRFDMGSINSQLNDAKDRLNNLAGTVDQVDETIGNLNDLANDLSKKTAYITMTTDDSGNPCIELGKSDNDFKVRITNTSIDFMEGSSKIAYLSNSSLYIERAVIKNEFQIGEETGYIWKKRSNNHMGLRWLGG